MKMYKTHIKPILDVTFGIILCMILLPILIVLAICVFISLGSPIIFKQERVGKDFKPFIMYKFRTMREPRKGENRLLSDADRVTKFGAFLRKTSLDELPELINVIKGDMSLVGPRPLLELHVELFNNEQKKRYTVKPGMTGLAQVMGRQFLSFSQRASLDVQYVNSLTFGFDLKIILKTILVVVGADGIKTGQKFEEVDDVGLKKLIEERETN